jgi:hypothetical protein
MTTVAIEKPNTAELEQAQSTVEARAKAITVESQADLEIAADFLRTVKTYAKQVVDTFAAAKSAAHKAHNEITTTEKKFLGPLTKAEAEVKGKVSAYTMWQNRIRAEEQRRLAEEARKAEEDRRLKEAERLEAEGQTEAAEQVVSAPVVTPVVAAPTPAPKAEGISTRKVWRFRINDANAIPRQYMVPNEKAIAEYARSMKGQANMPGVEFYAEDVVSAKALY